MQVGLALEYLPPQFLRHGDFREGKQEAKLLREAIEFHLGIMKWKINMARTAPCFFHSFGLWNLLSINSTRQPDAATSTQPSSCTSLHPYLCMHVLIHIYTSVPTRAFHCHTTWVTFLRLQGGLDYLFRASNFLIENQQNFYWELVHSLPTLSLFPVKHQKSSKNNLMIWFHWSCKKNSFDKGTAILWFHWLPGVLPRNGKLTVWGLHGILHVTEVAGK